MPFSKVTLVNENSKFHWLNACDWSASATSDSFGCLTSLYFSKALWGKPYPHFINQEAVSWVHLPSMCHGFPISQKGIKVLF